MVTMSNNHKEEFQKHNGVFYASIKLAAKICGVSVSTMTKWRDEDNPPPYNDSLKMYPIDQLGEWSRKEQIYKMGTGRSFPYLPDFTRYPERVWKKMGMGKINIAPPPKTPVNMMPGAAYEPPRQEDQKERYDRLRADSMEFKIKKEMGQYVLADEVLLAMTSMVSRVKTRMLALPSQLAPALAGKTDPTDIQLYLDEELRISLEELDPDYSREIDFQEGLDDE